MEQSSDTSRRSFLRTLAGTSAGLGLSAALGACSSTAESTEDVEAQAAALGPLPATVPRRKLGSTGETIPILLLGCAQKFDPKYDKVLHRAFKEGVNYLDTALSYANGQSHRTIAPFLKQIPNRKDIWITSKGGIGPGNPKGIEAAIDKCLAQLETDYLDLFYMHGIDDLRLLGPEFLAAGDAMRKAKKTRFFGFSCHGAHVAALLDKAAEVGGIDAIMFRFSFSQYGDLKLNQAIDKCKKAGIGLIAMKTQASVPAAQEEVVGFKSKNFTLPQAKLKAVWADDRIDAAVSHMDNTKKLAQNVVAAKSPVELSMNEMQQLQLLARSAAPYSCQGCAHICEPLLGQSVKVADSLRFLMYHECYGESDRAKELYRKMEPFDVRGIDFTRATAACPQGIDIGERLRLAQYELGEGLA